MVYQTERQYFPRLEDSRVGISEMERLVTAYNRTPTDYTPAQTSYTQRRLIDPENSRYEKSGSAGAGLAMSEGFSLSL